MTNVGGDPSVMTGGAEALHTAGRALEQLESPMTDRLRAVAGHAGDEVLAGATRWFCAAYATHVGQTGTQAVVAAQLAANAAADLRDATGRGG